MPLIVLVTAELGGVTILQRDTDAALVSALSDLVPEAKSMSAKDARIWLRQQQGPSGWFSSIKEAMAAMSQERKPVEMTAYSLSSIRAELGLPRAAFATELGFQGSDNTRHKQVWEMEKGLKPILPERARRALALLAMARLSEQGG